MRRVRCSPAAGSGDITKGDFQNVRNCHSGRLCGDDDRRHADVHPQGDRRRGLPCRGSARRLGNRRHEHRRHMDLGSLAVHFLGDGLYTRRPGDVLVYGAECAVPDPVYPLCKEDSGAVPGGHHLDRLHDGALSLRQGQGCLLLPARRAGRSLNGGAAACRRKDAGPHYGSAVLEHDACPGSYRIFLFPLLRAESLHHHRCRPTGHYPPGRRSAGRSESPHDRRL